MKKLHNMVLDTLRKYPETRNSDNQLQCKVIEIYYGQNYLFMPYSVVLLHHSELPSIESVGRARRKCQELHPELKADANVEASRELKQETFVDYARNTFI